MTGSDRGTGARATAPLDLTQTLEQIEGAVWPMPCCAPYLVAQSHALRRKPIGSFSTEDLRLMVDQDVGSAVLKPLVLARLAENPQAEGAYYPGDLREAAIKRWPDDTELRGGARGRSAMIVT